MPKQGASSGFKYGRATGAIEAALACCEIPLTIVEPSAWKKAHHLRGGGKERADSVRCNSSLPHTHCSPARRTTDAPKLR